MANRQQGEDDGASNADEDEVMISGWTFHSKNLPILNDGELTGLIQHLSTDPLADADSSCGSVAIKGAHLQLPEILFGNSILSVSHEVSNTTISFDARGALQSWADLHAEGRFEVIKVDSSQKWESRGFKTEEYDWTWRNEFVGASERKISEASEGDGWSLAQGTGGVNSDLLRDTTAPILFYTDVPLFEDFLHDHGVTQMNVKIRVMPSCWYLLLRHWLRIDGQLLQIAETRYFHEFGTSEVYRETTRRKASFDDLGSAGLSVDPKHYSTPEEASQALSRVGGEPWRKSEVLHLPS